MGIYVQNTRINKFSDQNLSQGKSRILFNTINSMLLIYEVYI